MYQFHDLVGPNQLVCEHCQEWSETDFPKCVEPASGQVHILWSSGPFLRLQANGSLVFTPGKDYRMHCMTTVGGAFPSWSHPEEAMVSISNSMVQVGGKMMEVAMLSISNADSKHSGIYKCDGGKGNPRYIELIKGKPGCGRFQRPYSSLLVIEPDKEFYVLGQSFTFRCPPGYLASSDAERVFCLRGGWSETTVPECNEYWRE